MMRRRRYLINDIIHSAYKQLQNIR